MSKTVTIPEKIESLLEASKTSPSALLGVVLFEALARDYDGLAKALFRRRAQVLNQIYKLPEKSAVVRQLRGMGVQVTISPAGDIGPDLWKSGGSDLCVLFNNLSNNYPKSTRGGVERVSGLAHYKKGPAYLYLILGLLGSNFYPSAMSSSMAILQELTPFKRHEDSVAGLYDSALFVFGNNQNGTATLRLNAVAPQLQAELTELCKAEGVLLTKMRNDAELLFDRLNLRQLRNLTAVVKKLPDLMQRKDFVKLIGFNDDPVQERANLITRVFTGEGILAGI